MKILKEIKQGLADELGYNEFKDIPLNEAVVNLVAIRYAQEQSNYAFKKVKEIYESRVIK